MTYLAFLWGGLLALAGSLFLWSTFSSRPVARRWLAVGLFCLVSALLAWWRLFELADLGGTWASRGPVFFIAVCSIFCGALMLDLRCQLAAGLAFLAGAALAVAGLLFGDSFADVYSGAVWSGICVLVGVVFLWRSLAGRNQAPERFAGIGFLMMAAGPIWKNRPGLSDFPDISLVLVSAGVLFLVYAGWKLLRLLAKSEGDHWYFRRLVIFVSLGVLLLAFGSPFVLLSVSGTEREWREQLQQEVELAATGFNQQDFAGLIGEPEDAGAPAYAALKSRLQRITRAGSGYNFAYLMAARDGGVVFLADSEPSGSGDESLPGDVYDDASVGLLDLFREGGSLVEGPIEDEWGVWISGLAALPDVSLDGSPVVLGVDRDAKGWFGSLGRRRLLMMGVIAFAMLLLVASYLTIEFVTAARLRQARSEERLRLTLQGSRMASWEIDFRKDQISLDGIWHHLIGTDPDGETMPLASFLALVSAEDRDRVRIGFQQLQQSDSTAIEDEVRFLSSGGQRTWLLIRGRQLRTGTGQPLGISGLALDISERKRTSELQKLQGAALESAANAILISDPKGRIEWVNKAFENLTGYARQEVIGRTPNVLKSGKHPRDFYTELWGTVLSGKVWSGQLCNRRKDGSLYDEEMTITPVMGGEGSVAHFIAVKQDISQRIRQQNEIEAGRKERERLAKVVENTTNGVLVTDADGRTEWINAAFTRITGYSLDEIKGKKPGSILQGEGTDQAVVARIRQAVHRGGDFSETLLNYRKDGRAYWIQINAEAQRDNAGELTGFVAIEQDVTEQLETQKIIEAERSRLVTLLENMDEGVLVEDENRQVTFANRAFERMFQIKADDLIGQDCGELARSASEYFADPVGFLDSIEVAISSSSACLERLFETVDGRFLARDFVPIRDSKRLIGYLWQYRDVTESHLSKVALEEAKEAAESANRAKSAFLATMSHEIRTPLNAVIGMTSLLLSTRLDEQQRDYAQTVATSGESLLDLINDILDYSKIEAGHMEIETSPFRLADAVVEPLEILAGDAGAKGLDLNYYLDPSLPEGVLGDRTRLRQVILNLLSNAVKFTSKGSITLEVEKGDDRPDSIHFCVRDTGIGMSPEVTSRLFQPFMQADSSVTRRYGGTGLGLAISWRMVALMGGTIEVNSREGEGSAFSFSLPLPAAEAPASSPTPGKPRLDGLRVLVVDDSAVNRRFLFDQCRLWNMEVQTAASGREALQILGDSALLFDLVLMDFQMPEMNGIDVARKMSGSGAGSRPTVILLSSVSDSLAAEERRLFGATLTKPIRPSTLKRIIGSVMGQTPHSTPQPDPPSAETGKFADLKVLLVEDNPTNQKVAKLLFKKMGISPDLALDGREAVESAAEKCYDVIFMDVQMPVMDGLEATRLIRSATDSASHGSRIIAMTANAFSEDREACFAAGMDDYLAKPVTIDGVRAALHRALPEA